MSTENKPITVRMLKKKLGNNYPYAEALGICKALPKTKKGEMRRYEVLVEELPSRASFVSLLKEEFQTSLSDLLSGAFCDIEALAEEISEWYENMGENLQCSSKGEELQECSDILENIEEIEIEIERVEVLKISYIPTPSQDIKSRRDRLSEAVSAITAVQETIQKLVDEEDGSIVSPSLTEEEYDLLRDEVIEALENATDELDGVNFPSMY